jgi:hypothetical protein
MLSLEAARKVALSLPGAEERDQMGSPSFQVKRKIFAQLPALHKRERHVLIKLSIARQASLVRSDTATFSAVPGWWGTKGWTYVQLAQMTEPVLRDLLLESWRIVAPKKLAANFPAD